MSADRRLIVGLGNPGPEYAWTPHNLGFLAIDFIAEQAGIRVTRPEAQSYVGIGEFAGHAVMLAKPQTMMNASGAAVRMLLDRHELDPAEMIVLVDDFDLPWGMLRIRPKGSPGTHNGLRSVVGGADTVEFIRIRMGVGPEKRHGELRDYVLGRMSKAQREIATEMIESAADAVSIIMNEGTEKAMTKYNRRVKQSEEGEDQS